MKMKIGFLLLLILSAFSASGAVIQGTSGPFPLDTSSALPVSLIALAVSAGLIGGYTVFRSVRSRKKASS